MAKNIFEIPRFGGKMEGVTGRGDVEASLTPLAVQPIEAVTMLKFHHTVEPSGSQNETEEFPRRGIHAPGFIYAAVSTDGLVKLGLSTKPAYRVIALQNKPRCELLALAHVQDMWFDERLLHWDFSNFHRCREWFECPPQLAKDHLNDWSYIRPQLLASIPPDFKLDRRRWA